ncbi:Predicted dehydrogenase [Saccharicrinis carchari]|uniref:Predicted dehydrogenase n=1 Tax=Saccharicrinis carchari TaxID=1168039 RepID=A0A521CZB6_SACCC|nr:Gfo/Idh/MocA family oxidoreductase [Saccharicrinis carchari]SMO64091.1 Predicted dehydrogenase [Saccharicrinis carchari]
MLRKIFIIVGILLTTKNLWATQPKTLRLGVAGLTHGHVGWILSRKDSGDVKMVGIVETNKVLAQRLSSQYGFSMNIVYDTMEEMIAATQPEAVAAFGSIYEHLMVVEACAPAGIHVMVEKPLAVNLAHAKKMKALAQKHNIHLLTNYETSWYPTNFKAHQLLHDGAIGELRKVIIRDGHSGFKNVKINDEFFQWLTDPVLNGGGAIMDFGCYGANLMTWLLKGEKPNSITAVTQQLQPEVNPKVDDDATILLNYDKAMAILQPSWNWPIGRKDMELYGTTGVIYADNRNQLRVRKAEGYDGFSEETFQLQERPAPFNDPFAVLAALIHGSLELEKFDPYSIENNMITMEILDSAVKSAKSKQTVQLKE